MSVLEKRMNTERGGSSLAVIESYDVDNALGDNYAEQTEISRKRPRNPQFTKRSSTQDHLERNENKAELIRQSSRHWRSPLRSVECASTHGTSHLLRHIKNVHQMDLSSLSELGDTSRKRLKGTKRTKSAVWLHFTKLPSVDPDEDRAKCNRCKEIYKCGSKKHGTSPLLRHLKNIHQIDLTVSEAWKEPQRSSCSQKLQSTGSAACAGDTSRNRLKGTKRTKSAVWLHFTKLPSADPDEDRAECNRCKEIYKCGSKKHGTSPLLRHLKNIHQIDLTVSEAWKEPQRSSCSQKLQSTGSAACAGIPTPLTEQRE